MHPSVEEYRCNVCGKSDENKMLLKGSKINIGDEFEFMGETYWVRYYDGPKGAYVLSTDSSGLLAHKKTRFWPTKKRGVLSFLSRLWHKYVRRTCPDCKAGWNYRESTLNYCQCSKCMASWWISYPYLGGHEKPFAEFK